MHDVIIKNGTVIDGSGEPMFLADIAINDMKITEIGDLGGEKAYTEIDARGKYVMPGFIDISNRSDVYWRLFQDPTMESLLRQGITTIIGGNSGASLAPLYNEQMFLSTQKWTDVRGVNVNWQTMSEFFTAVENRHLSMNFGTFVGHGTLRRGIVGDEMRELTKSELKSLVHHAAQAMKDGALGVSLGLVYTHARSANNLELVALAKEVKEQGGLMAAHLRDEDQDLITALDEVLAVTEETGVATHITHLKAVGQQYWSLMAEALEHVNLLRAQGHPITFDVYPYTHTGSVLYTFLPHWVSEGGKNMLLSRLQNENIYAQVRKEMSDSRINFASAIIATSPNAEHLKGRTLGDIARERGVDVPSLILDLLIASDGRVIIIFKALSEENIERALMSPYSMVTSNAPGYTLSKSSFKMTAHPRSFGAFPRLFARYVREQKMLTWEMAVHKSTGKVAEQCNITNRGFLREGYYADIVICDPEKIRDKATVQKPMEYAVGIDHMIINGIPTIADGKLTGIRGGQVIRHKT